MSQYAVEVNGLSKRYRIRNPKAMPIGGYLRRPLRAAREPRTLDVEVLRDVNFDVKQGEVFGIIGRNGAGKSTLLKILARITSPSGGRATIRGRVASLLEVGTGFHPELTGRENVYLNGMLLGMPSREVDRVFDQICDFAGIGAYIDTPIKRYSSGMQLRLAFAVAAHLAADTMIVDEVLAVGDAEFQAKCTQALRDAAGHGRTTLFVSHNMAAVENLCSRALLLQQGVVQHTGPAKDVVREYLRGVLPSEGANANYAVNADHVGKTAAWFTSAQVCGSDGGMPVQGEDIVVTVEFEVIEQVRKLQISLAVATTDGALVSALSNGDYRGEWDVRPGSYRAKIHLHSPRLVPRTYSLSLRAMQGWGAEIFDDVPDALTFNVLGRDVLGTGVPLLADRGITWSPASYEITALAGAKPL